ncbi:hypothetical protein AB6A40_001218 [Gnathostoma spinigerum]|uniref:Uncharacterized protein n=1 Tax=Gnathostoma spinigerum TaxID=75299 RepID=A0ABD6EAY9_9BILA
MSFQSDISEASNDCRKLKCFGGRLNVINAVHFVIVVGVISVATLIGLQSIYCPKFVFVAVIPTAVLLFTIVAAFRRNHIFMWPIIAISCFHLMLAVYLLYVVTYLNFVKPLYVLMVFNWMFDKS